MAEVIKRLKLVLIDEIQHIGDHRGAVLESVICRTKLITQQNVRYIAVSATCPNASDIGDWLGCSRSNVLCFGEEYRPVTLTKIVKSFPPGKNQFLFQQNLKYKLFEVIAQYHDGKPTLVFCCSRKETTSSCQQFLKDSIAYNEFSLSPAKKNEISLKLNSINDKTLRDVISRGVAFYHAGLSFSDRNLVQELFVSGYLKVVCTTSSLSKGVNLPAHLVVIQGTQLYSAGMYEELSIIDTLQMIGRAGRPQFDTSGVAVIMTSDETKSRYQNLVSGQELVESKLMDSIPTCLNTEIALGTIRNIKQAQLWLLSTYLYCRILNNPVHYNVPSGLNESKLESYLREMLVFAIQDLKTAEMVKVKENGILVPLQSGICMSRYSIAFDTMKLFQEIDCDEISMQDIILVLAKASEFSQITLRRSEKQSLNELHQNIKFPLVITGKRKSKLKLIQTSQEKIFVLIQVILGDIEIQDWSLKQDANQIITSLVRIMKGAISYFINNPKAKLLEFILLLNQSISQRMWFDSLFVCKQIDKIGKKLCDLLVQRQITSLEEFERTDPRVLEEILKRNVPFGNKVQQSLTKIWPKMTINFKVQQCHLHIRILAQNPIPRNKKFASGNYSTLLITEKETNQVLLAQNMVPNFAESPYEVKIPFSKNGVICKLFNNDFVGMNVEKEFQDPDWNDFAKSDDVDDFEYSTNNYKSTISDNNTIESKPIHTSKFFQNAKDVPKQTSSVGFQNKLEKFAYKKNDPSEPKSYFKQQTNLGSTIPNRKKSADAPNDDQIMNLLNEQKYLLTEEKNNRANLESRIQSLEGKLDKLIETVVATTQKLESQKSPHKSNENAEAIIPLHPEGRGTSKWYSLAKKHSSTNY